MKAKVLDVHRNEKAGKRYVELVLHIDDFDGDKLEAIASLGSTVDATLTAREPDPPAPPANPEGVVTARSSA